MESYLDNLKIFLAVNFPQEKKCQTDYWKFGDSDYCWIHFYLLFQINSVNSVPTLQNYFETHSSLFCFFLLLPDSFKLNLETNSILELIFDFTFDQEQIMVVLYFKRYWLNWIEKSLDAEFEYFNQEALHIPSSSERISLTIAAATIDFATAVEYAAEIKSDQVIKMRILAN